jgi:DNA-binding LacI/PurR family transcriptional regulator
MRGVYGVVTDPLATALANTERQRLSGWLHPLRDAGITPLIVRERHGDPYEVGRSAARVLLEQDVRPTGVLCFSDAVARGVIGGVAAAGLHVPNDMSVVGFDDSPLSRRTEPALTTVRQDVGAKGRAAASALVAAIGRSKTRTSGRGRHLLLPTELVVRESTAASATRSPARRRHARSAR